MLRYVCLSDLHAGADASLVTPLAGDTNQGKKNGISSVTASFVNAVHGFLDAYPKGVASNSGKALPQLVLLGDMLDLAFSDRGKASEIFGGFLSVFAGPNGADHNAKKRFQDKLIVIPGNHDHSLWTGSRYAYEARKIGSGDKAGSDRLLRATKAFSSTPYMQCPLIDRIAKQVGLKGKSDLRYPNFGTTSKDGKKAVVFHHGHFIEGTYRLMSTIAGVLAGQERLSLTVEQLSSENANWIDFGWSTFGDATSVGDDITALYEYLSVGSEAHILKSRIANAIEPLIASRLPMGGERKVQQLVRMTLMALIDATFVTYSDNERFSQTHFLSPSSLAGLAWYLAEPTKTQIKKELSAVPEDLTFIFGHTHKPFEDSLVVDGFNGPVPTCNTGGWMLDTPRLDGKEGASLVLVDDDHNVVSIRMFQTSEASRTQNGIARLVSSPCKSGEAFLEKVNFTLGETTDLWLTLAGTANDAYKSRQEYLLEHTHSIDVQSASTGAIL